MVKDCDAVVRHQLIKSSCSWECAGWVLRTFLLAADRCAKSYESFLYWDALFLQAVWLLFVDGQAWVHVPDQIFFSTWGGRAAIPHVIIDILTPFLDTLHPHVNCCRLQHIITVDRRQHFVNFNLALPKFDKEFHV